MKFLWSWLLGLLGFYVGCLYIFGWFLLLTVPVGILILAETYVSTLGDWARILAFATAGWIAILIMAWYMFFFMLPFMFGIWDRVGLLRFDRLEPLEGLRIAQSQRKRAFEVPSDIWCFLNGLLP